jgi:Flp pilus assembly protein TadG
VFVYQDPDHTVIAFLSRRCRPSEPRRRLCGTSALHGKDAESGQMLVMVALSTLVLFGIVGLAIDLGRMYIMRAELSRAVDAAALSGVLELNGTSAGLTAAQSKAQTYFDYNEPDATATITADGGQNMLTVQGSKSVDMYFLSIFGVSSANVSARAVAGFGNLTVDTALVIDATASMGYPLFSGCNSSNNNSGCAIYEAKNAATNFANILLGTNPSGNVVVGLAPFRGCYRTTPMPSTKTDCIDISTQVANLTSTLSTLTPKIAAITPGSISSGNISATNVCIGLAKGYTVLNGAGNHTAEENNRRYMVLLSDGDNWYWGNYTYQASPQSPESVTIGSTSYSCQPPSACTNVGGNSSGADPCHPGTFNGPTAITEDFAAAPPWTGGVGWSAAWVPSTSTTAVVGTNTTSPQSGTHRLQLARSSGVVGSIYRQFSLESYSTASVSYYVRRNSGFSGSDTVCVQIATSASGPWTNLKRYGSATCTGSGSPSNTAGSVGTGSWFQDEIDLDAYVNQTSLFLRFHTQQMDTNGDQFYIDNIVFGGGNSNGFLNGFDGGTGCGASVKRERQIDIETWEIAKAAEAQNIEIFVVGFGVCDPSNTGTLGSATNPLYTLAQCNSQIGNTDSDTIADERLMKCIASSKDGTNDHYFYASTAASLPTIFTSIAQQIAHRLVE